MEPIIFFLSPHSVAQKQYEALRLYFVESVKAREVAKKYGYTYRGFTTIVSEFRNKLSEGNTENLFFVPSSKGRPPSPAIGNVNQTIIELRKIHVDRKFSLPLCNSWQGGFLFKLHHRASPPQPFATNH